jgi:hypothetical protein
MNLEDQDNMAYTTQEGRVQRSFGRDRKISLPVFHGLQRFLTELNIGQTTNRQSYRAANIKSRLLEQWFGWSNPVTRKFLKSNMTEHSSYIERSINRYLDNGRCTETNGHLYPSESLTEDIADICIRAQTPHEWKKGSIKLNVSKDILGLSVLINERGNDPLCGVSGQLIRIELSIWEQLLSQRNLPLCSSELANRSRIQKSTLTTLLDAAIKHKLFISAIDVEDERITRWTLNSRHNRNKYIKSLLEENVETTVR